MAKHVIQWKQSSSNWWVWVLYFVTCVTCACACSTVELIFAPTNIHGLLTPPPLFYASFMFIPLNLQSPPHIAGTKDAVSFEKRKEFYLCCLLFCFKTLPLNIVAKLPASGFTPGQRIDLTLDIENLSSKNVRNFKVELYKVCSSIYLIVCAFFTQFFAGVSDCLPDSHI